MLDSGRRDCGGRLELKLKVSAQGWFGFSKLIREMHPVA
jgi:hypothetical protein